MIEKTRKEVNKVVPDENGKVTMSGRVMSKKAYDHCLNYKNDYDKGTYKRVTMRLRFGRDDMLLDYLSKQENVCQLLKTLATEKMKKDIKKGLYTPEEKEK